MKKLVKGIVEFHNKLTEEGRHLFAQLALGQKPDALFIGCSDSRVVPNLFASTDPGDLFVVRNVGNIVPTHESAAIDSSAAAAIEFALASLEVADIVICGHSECGAMQAIAGGVEKITHPHLKAWLKHGISGKEISLKPDPKLSPHNQLSQANVLLQMEHLKTYPVVRERLDKGTLRLHGWWFEIARADVSYYNSDQQRFILVEDDQVKAVLRGA